LETRIGWAAQKWCRIDRLATLYVVHPLRQWVAPRPTSHIPILMYHSVSEQESDGRHPYFETTTAPKVFAEHMKFLKEAGYRSLTLNEAVSQIESGEQVCEPKVVLTFDDGFQDFYTQAFPILQEHQFTATVFLPTTYIAEERRQFKRWHCMTWGEVREMRKSGIQFGSHTVNHRQLNVLEKHHVEEELRCSKETIEDQLGHPVESFSYPFAFPETDRVFTRILKDLLVAQGYKDGVTTVIGTFGAGNDVLFLPRLPVNSSDDLRLFRAKLKGGYDWLHLFQRSIKQVKGGIV
jgi:peptidoglycan/xylan/chitin deacetylase (PgdA/CDA1 family)